MTRANITENHSQQNISPRMKLNTGIFQSTVPSIDHFFSSTPPVVLYPLTCARLLAPPLRHLIPRTHGTPRTLRISRNRGIYGGLSARNSILPLRLIVYAESAPAILWILQGITGHP